jgi:hypothetical protein
VRLYDIFHILGADMNIGRIIGHNPDNGTFSTESKATSSHDIHPTAQVVVGNQMNEPVNDTQATRIVTRRTAATQDLDVIIGTEAVVLLWHVLRLSRLTARKNAGRILIDCIH